ncbi:MAG: N-acyl-D-amino-acid deacylase family protein [Acidimicrobiales bacterium]
MTWPGSGAARVIVTGGEILDGTGSRSYSGDLVIEGGVIRAVTDKAVTDKAVTDKAVTGRASGSGDGGETGGGETIIDAAGLVVCPGFIDVHSHADNAPFLDDDDTSKIMQGVTTEVVGNCGFSLAPQSPERASEASAFLERLFPPLPWPGGSRGGPFAELLAATDAAGYVTNVAPLVGHGALRVAAMGMAARQPDGAELGKMAELLDEALQAGAFGFSSGLVYPPGVYSSTDELVSLAARLPRGRVYASHIRGEGLTVVEAVREAIEIAERTGASVEVSHHKASGKASWGRTAQTLALLAEARERGAQVDQDVYPYDAASTVLAALLPPWSLEGTDADVLARLSDAELLERLRVELGRDGGGFENHAASLGYDRIVIGTTASHRFEGETLAQIAQRWGCAGFDALVRLLVEERLRANMIVFSMSEEDVERVIADPHTTIGSDGLPPGLGGKPHPRLYGTFPRVIARYVRDRRVLSLEDAVAKMTSRPAAKFGIPDRGVLRPGMVADLVCFDRARISDTGDYGDPGRPPAGISWVMVAGELAVAGGRYLGRRLGRRLLPAGM